MAEFTEQQSVGRREVPKGADDQQTAMLHAREIRKRTDEIVAGKVNWGGDFTLEASANNTVVSDGRVTQDSEISLHPLTADAASLINKVHIDTTDLTPGTTWGATPVGQFTVRHAIVATTNFKYRYSIKG